MAFISQVKFAKLASASETQIKNAIRDGKLHRDPKSKGLDPNHPKNKAWLEEWARKDNKPGPKPASRPPKELSDDLSGYANLEDQKIEQEIKLKKEQTLAIKQKRLASIGVLILRETVEKRMAKLGQSLKTHVLTVPRKISPKIHAMVKSGSTVGEIEKEIATELEKALRNAKT